MNGKTHVKRYSLNREYSREIIYNLLQWGVEEFYICAGARDIPLIETVCHIQSEKKIVFNHFEERSVAFYALGRIKSIKKPVAVITTSGTAVGELLPAVMEAYYSKLPLVLITADRPKSYRGTGAPQSAEQKNIFGVYVSKCFDLSLNETFDLTNITKNQPLHLNICFDIPLQSGNLEKININLFKENQNLLNKKTDSFTKENEELERFLSNSNNLMVIVSQLNENNYSGIINFLKKLNTPVYIESISNIRECDELEHLKIKCADKIWNNAKDSNYIIDSILKIGGTPTHRIWRDLDETNKQIKVLSVSDRNFSGMPNAKNICVPIHSFLSSTNVKMNQLKPELIHSFLKTDKECHLKLLKLFNKYPESEQAIFFYLSEKIENNSRVYLGNSLPIRHWDLSASFLNKNFIVDASRGLNGIDGQISSFLGFAEETTKENWGIFGDLTTLYDMPGMWMLRQRPTLNANIVIINNGGGKIFNKVLTGDISILCQNIHDLNFEYLAKFWGLDYEIYTDARKINNTKRNRVIEIKPNQEQTDLLSNEFLRI